jgi:hypothetical protein
MYFDYITERLSTLATAINSLGKLNVLNLHNHAESFYQHFLKKIYGWNFVNLNTIKNNEEAIDLICTESRIVVQVSSTCTKGKIEAALSGKILEKYNGFCFKFVSISKDASSLRKNSYITPLGISFNPATDICDIASILSSIKELAIEDQREVFDFIKKELGSEVDMVKLDSNLTTIVDILSKLDLSKNEDPITINSFEIDRKISFNNLSSAKYTINDFKIHHSRLDKIYSKFDESGANKSNSVLEAIRKEYIQNVNTKNDDDLFYIVIENIQKKIVNSKNFFNITSEELCLCVNVIVVDSFIRCKIFKNPSDYKYAIA